MTHQACGALSYMGLNATSIPCDWEIFMTAAAKPTAHHSTQRLAGQHRFPGCGIRG